MPLTLETFYLADLCADAQCGYYNHDTGECTCSVERGDIIVDPDTGQMVCDIAKTHEEADQAYIDEQADRDVEMAFLERG